MSSSLSSRMACSAMPAARRAPAGGDQTGRPLMVAEACRLVDHVVGEAEADLRQGQVGANLEPGPDRFTVAIAVAGECDVVAELVTGRGGPYLHAQPGLAQPREELLFGGGSGEAWRTASRNVSREGSGRPVRSALKRSALVGDLEPVPSPGLRRRRGRCGPSRGSSPADAGSGLRELHFYQGSTLISARMREKGLQGKREYLQPETPPRHRLRAHAEGSQVRLPGAPARRRDSILRGKPEIGR